MRDDRPLYLGPAEALDKASALPRIDYNFVKLAGPGRQVVVSARRRQHIPSITLGYRTQKR